MLFYADESQPLQMSNVKNHGIITILRWRTRKMKKNKTKRKKIRTNKNILEGKRSIRITIANQDQFSICHTLFQNEIKPAEFIKVESALLLQAPDHCESNH